MSLHWQAARVEGGGAGAGVTCETFIPDFTGELYGDAVRVRFCKFLWLAQKFDSLEALTAMVNRAEGGAGCRELGIEVWFCGNGKRPANSPGALM
ncbi:MAG: hypothetical protein HDT26_13660 [Subdoligranulum sp.]|nr:hypothetical protein [Subdoligranulum sp.]MBD5095290.1 hypothetical protein [Subdoligranulum sp.]